MSEHIYQVLLLTQRYYYTALTREAISGNKLDHEEVGIDLSQVGGTVSGNFLRGGSASIGISDVAGADAMISGNTLLNEIEGIDIAAPGAAITSNEIQAWDLGVNFQCSLSNVSNNALYVHGGGTITQQNSAVGLANVPTTFTGRNFFYDTDVNRKGGCR